MGVNNLSYEERVVNAGMAYLGCPYIWGAKGELKLFDNAIAAVHCFDCSGLVTYAMKMAGGPDLSHVDNSQRLFDEGADVTVEALAWLEFYGTDEQHVTHVAIAFGDALNQSALWSLECAGGDSTTVAPKPGACVMLHSGRYEGPGHKFLGAKLIPR